jgi:hypothetical protein
MTMAQVCGFVLCLFIGLLALTILFLIWKKEIDLSELLSEANGDASMSRFQLLIFTFVIAISLFEIVESGMKFPDIPAGILTLLGISASTYAVGKGISYSQPDVMLGTAGGDDDEEDEGSDADAAKAHADEAKAHADVAKQAAQQAQDALNQAKGTKGQG